VAVPQEQIGGQVMDHGQELQFCRNCKIFVPFRGAAAIILLQKERRASATTMEGGIFLLILIVIGFAVYFLPYSIARIRRTEHGPAIFWVNVFFGWTVLGWIAALIWAVTETAAHETALAQSLSAKSATWDFHDGWAKQDDATIERANQPDPWVLE
jgi:T4 superinfection immunity protein